MNDIWVAAYTHEYGTDCRAFETENGARAWKDEIAKEWWDDAFPDMEIPENNVGDEYFNRMIDRDDFCEEFNMQLALISK